MFIPIFTITPGTICCRLDYDDWYDSGRAVGQTTQKKFGKAEISVVANIMSGIVCVVYFFAAAKVWVYVAFQTLCFLVLAFCMVSWALITDVIDYSR
jgi:Na+/melibiose symporter-like transporter